MVHLAIVVQMNFYEATVVLYLCSEDAWRPQIMFNVVQKTSLA